MTLSSKEIEQFLIDAGSDSLAVFGGAYEGGIHIQQVPDEIAPCISAVLESGKNIKSMLEIGSASGGTTYVFNHFFSPERIVLIDDNNHPKHIFRSDVLKGIDRQEIIGNSRDQEIIDQVNGLFDLMIIDGDHSYHGVKADIDNYLPMLKKGGFLILHDTVTTVWGCEVSRMTRELKKDARVGLIGEYISIKGPVCGVALFRKVV